MIRLKNENPLRDISSWINQQFLNSEKAIGMLYYLKLRNINLSG